jgi:hypothetical protein
MMEEENSKVVKSTPSLKDMVFNFTKAVVAHAQEGFKTVEPVVYEKRMSECLKCPLLIPESQRCSLCGCYMPTKVGWSVSECADLKNPKWLKDNG